ncbi:MAG: hypothetical protein ACRDCE_17495 [Cetobacterium sp.]|uniref:hypothetical protein n=1 Tax=Cetobacterium sp. TaxID=2071632 RepID=UPI003EE6FD8F
MDTQVKAVAGLSREQMKVVILWMIEAGRAEAAATISAQYGIDVGFTMKEHLEFSREVSEAAGNEAGVAKADFMISIAVHLLEAGYPETKVMEIAKLAAEAWVMYHQMFGQPPVVVSAPSAETLDIGIPGFYFVKP